MRLFFPTVDMLVEAPPFVAPAGVCLDPSRFPSLGAPPSGSATFDTDALEGDGFAGRGVVFQQAPGSPEIAVFVFEEGELAGELTLRGSRPAALLFRGDARVCADVDARRAGARPNGPGLASSAGGGGGFGGRGGSPAGACRGGPGYGLASAFEIGSGGQRGAAPGGLGGGGVQIGALGVLELRRAHVRADGQPGHTAPDGPGGGGGSGGTVILHGARVRLDPHTYLSVRGGDGGAGGGTGLGGGGGAGGYILGASEPAGCFDPQGAHFATSGGLGGDDAGGERPGRGGIGGRGVVYLAAKRPSFETADGRARPMPRRRQAWDDATLR